MNWWQWSLYRLWQLRRALQKVVRRSPRSWVRSRAAAEDWEALCSAVVADAPSKNPYSLAYDDHDERRGYSKDGTCQ